jgi:ABC-type multidrug transport system permease subunit
MMETIATIMLIKPGGLSATAINLRSFLFLMFIIFFGVVVKKGDLHY